MNTRVLRCAVGAVLTTITVATTILLRVSVAEGGTVFFEDTFDGTSVDPTKWSVSTNGYPAPAVSVSTGFLRMGQPGTGSVDFPYVISTGPTFPATGDFSLEFVVQYTSVAGLGDGIVVLGPANEDLLGVWQDSIYGLTTQLQGMPSAINLTDPLGVHTFRLDVVGATATLVVDGTEIANEALSARPVRLWLGVPTVGQTFGLYTGFPWPGCLDASGVVICRWWPPGTFTTFSSPLKKSMFRGRRAHHAVRPGHTVVNATFLRIASAGRSGAREVPTTRQAMRKRAPARPGDCAGCRSRTAPA